MVSQSSVTPDVTSRVCVLPLSADPPTLAHRALLKSALTVCDQVIWALGQNPRKQTLFSEQQRKQMLNNIVQEQGLASVVSVTSYSGSTARFAQQVGAKILVRGLRNCSDLQSESQQAAVNRQLTGIETCFFVVPAPYAQISSTLVRELIALEESIEPYVPKAVAEYIAQLNGTE